LLVAAFVGLGACDTPRPPPLSEAPSTPSAAPAAAVVSNSEPIGLERVVITIRPGTQIGSGRRGCALCSATPFLWDAGNIELRPDAFSAQFFDTMTAAGYRVVGNPRQLFDRDSERASARFLVGAQITEMDFTLDQIDWAFTGPSSKGDGRLKVAWQLYSLRERRVIYQTTSSGAGAVHRPGFQGAMGALMHNAFADATVKLSADRDFQAAVAAHDPARVVPASLGASEQSPFEVPRFARFTGPVIGRLPELLGSAVTIVFERGHGSGFFISDNGLILTNQHVVGDAETVNVRLLAGVEVVGRVLRRHARRDVALVKVDMSRTRPLPLRLEGLRVGEEVFALGAPVQTRLAGSVTRGIVSALRRELRGGVELDIIQSDAVVHGGSSGGPLLDAAGNVVGIAVEGIESVNQRGVGTNFFIPIGDALDKLDIRLGPPREVRF
jgi:S1-C subfamily serine protease